MKTLDPELFEILLIDRLNHHQFQPLFYQVATSQLEPTSITFPLRKLFRPCDVLVIATGCKTNFFGNSNLEKSGVELAGSFAEIRRKILPKDFSAADISRIRIILLEGSTDTLGSMSELAKNTSMSYLRSMGVEVMTDVFLPEI